MASCPANHAPAALSQEAARRCEEMVQSTPGCRMKCDFECTDQLGVREMREPRQYDVVGCMFALHYFFVTEAALHNLLHNVGVNLKEGGYFIGVLPEGKKVNKKK